MIEIAARMNPGSFNNPMMESGDADGIDRLEPARIGEVFGPIRRFLVRPQEGQ